MKQELQLIQEELQEVINKGQTIKDIETKDDYSMAGDILKIVKNKMKNIEDKRKTWTKPLDEAKKQIMTDVKEVLAPLQEMETLLKEKMIEFATAEQKRIEEKQKEIDEKAKKELEKTGESYKEVEIVPEHKTVRGDLSTSTVKETVSYEIEDITKIPMKYYVLDERMILTDIKNGIEIAGVKKVMKKSIAIR